MLTINGGHINDSSPSPVDTKVYCVAENGSLSNRPIVWGLALLARSAAGWIVPVVLGLAIAIAVGGSLLGTGRAAASYHPTFDSPAPSNQEWTEGVVNPTLQLSSASGGTGTLSYSLKLSDGSALPTGFVFTTSSRTLSSTIAVVAGSYTLNYRVTDSSNISAVHQFGVVVAVTPSVSDPADLRWSAGNLNTPVVLPAGSGGTGTLAYTLKLSDGNALPTGFVFTASSRTLASTIAVVAATRTLRYTVTDDNNASVYQDFDVVVVAAQSFSSSQTDLAWTAGHANTSVLLPAASGGTGTLAYTLKLSDGNALPTGFVFTTSSRTLASTTAVVAATRTLRYTVTDDNNVSVYQDFNVVVVAAQSFSSSQTDLAWTAGHANTSVLLPAASGGTGTLAYTLKLSDGNALPTGFEFTASSRTLSSTTDVVAATRTLRYTVTDDNNVSVYQDFNVVVAATPTVSDPADLRWSAGNLNTPVMLPAGSGGTGTLAYTLKLSDGNALPTGFVFTTSSRTLASTTAVVAATRTLRYTVTDDNNVSVYQDFNVVVVAAQSFSSSQTDLAWTAGHANTSVLLPAASGGTGTLAYTLKLSDGNALPTGFEFTASSRTLSSTTAVVAATRTLRYTVTDDNNVSVYQDFNVVVAATPTVSDPADLRWSAGNLNTPVMLPAGSGGTGTLAYTLKLSDGNALPTGFVFTASSRTLASTTDVVAATRTLRYTVTDDNNASVYQDFNVVVVAAQSFSSSQTDLAWTAGHANTSVLLPAASGGTGTLAYTLKLSDGNALPTGFVFTTSSRTLSNTIAVVAATRTLRYTVTDDNNVSVYQDFNVVVVAAQSFSSSQTDLAWTAGHANTSVLLPAASGGTGTLAYTLKLSDGNALPTGFEFTASSRTLASTTAVVAATRTLRYTVTDDNNVSVYQDFNVVVAATPSVSDPADLRWSAGNLNTPVMLPAGSGGTGTLAYTLKLSNGNALPTGFVFTTSSRTLSNTTDVVAATRTLRYTVTDDNNASVYQDFNVVVVAAQSFSSSQTDLAWTAGHANTSVLLPAASGGTGTLAYTLKLSDGNALPTGFEFTASSRTLSSTTDVVAATRTLRYTVTDDNNVSVYQDFNVVVAATPTVSDPADLRWSAGNLNTPVMLPAGSGGTGTLAYTLKLSDGNALPTGFVFTTSSRTLSNTTDVVAATRTLRYTVTDDNNVSVYQDFNVVVVAAQSFSSSQTDLAWTAGHANTSVLLPAASGGTGTLAYTLKLSDGNALPTGFEFTASSRTLSSTTAVVAATRTLRYTVTDDNNVSVYQDFNVVVAATPTVSDPADLRWSAGNLNTPVMLPAGSGGTGTLAYTLKLSNGNALPTGFVFTTSSRTLSNTTDVVAATRTLRYTVTDDNNASVYQDFNVVVVAAQSFSSSQTDLAWTAGHANTSVLLPAASGGTGTLAYTLKLSDGNALPTGFEFTASSRTLASTTAVVAATRTLRYTVTDDNNVSVYQDFNVVVAATPTVSDPADLRWSAGNLNTPVMLPAGSGGTGTLAYTLKLSNGNALPTGFVFTTSSRTLSNTTDVVAATRTLRYTVTDDNNASVYQDFNVVVVAAQSFSSSQTDLAWTAGHANTSVLLPAASGGTGTLAYTLKLSDGNALPTGFEFTASSRTLASTTAVVAATRTLRYTVTDDNNVSVYQDFNVVVAATPTVSDPADLRWSAGNLNTPVMLPAGSGGTGTLAYTLKLSNGNALPTGFEFTASSRTLSNTTDVVAATRTLRYTVTDDNNVSVYQDFNVVVVAAQSFSSSQTDLAWTAGHANTSVLLPAASGGTGTLAYTLKLSDGNALPTGFVFTASSRTLASTTAVVAATRTLRYTVTDDNNVSVYQDFNVVVAATPTVSDPADLRWSAGNLNTPVMLPAGSGGTGTLAYTLKLSNGNALPTGFVFTTSSRTLSNTTDVVAATRTLRYTVTDDNNASVYQDFNVVVVAAQSFSSSQTDLAWTAGHANTSVLLPAASGGTGTLAYTLKLSDGNALPTGFEFTASSRTLASTTAVVAATRTLRYTVTDDNNVSVYQDFNVVVAATPTVSDPADLRWSAGNLNTPVMLPAGSGGTGTLAYTLKLSNGNALPTGFVFTTSSRTLSNTTDVVAATRTLRYTVTDDNNASVYQDFNVVVVAAQSFSSSQTDLAWTAGHANTSVLLPAASGGTGTLAYTLKLSDGNALPTGFEFTASSRTLASTTAVVAATRTLRYTVTDDNNVSVYQDFNVVVAATPTVSDPADLRWSAGNLNTPVMLPAGSGGTGTLAYTLKLSNGNALPTGFVFTTSSRTLSNTTDVVAATRTLRYTVTDDNNASVYQDFNVVVVAAQSFSSSQTDLAWTAGHANTSVLLPAASGGTGTLAYTLKLSDGNALPTGFEFTASSRTLASTTAVVAATRTLRYTVTDDNNVSVYQDFNVVVAATPTVSDPADLRWSAGNLNTPVMLPAGSGGTGTLAYTLKLSNGNALPTGFVFTTSSRTLSNTTDVVAATRTLRYTVTDDNNASVYQDFNVVVVAAQSFSSSQTDLAWTAGHANTSVLLPAASGGTGTLAYTLKLSDGNALPTGFEFTASSRTLASTTAVVAATRTLRYTVTDDNNVSVYQDFNVVVAATPTVSDPADLRWSAGNLNTPVMLPAGSGGTGTLAYTLKLSNGNALPTGFEFTASSRTLSNTTDVVAATRTLRYTVTDDNNVSVYQDFNVVVVAAQSFSSSQTDLAWTAGHANTSVLLPAASGGTGTLAYTLKLSDGNALPTGFVFTASSRTLASTTAVVAATRTLRYTVTDDNNVSVYQDFNVVVAATPTVSDPADLRWSAGNLNTPVMLPAGSGGTGTLAYTLKLSNGNALPTGFVFTTSSRTLSNTTDVVAATRTLRYTVTDDNNASVYQDFNVVVVAAQSFSSSQTDLAWTAGHANTSVLLPAASGGTGTLAYTLKLSDGNALPTGFEFTASSRTLSSTTAVVAATRTLRYTVTDDNNVSVYQDFNVVVAATPTVSDPADLRWSAGNLNTPVMLPAGSGGTGTLAYTLKLSNGNALPTGFVFTTSSRTLSNTTDVVAATRTLRYTVTDDNNASVYQDFNVVVVAAQSFSSSQTDLAWTAGHANTSVLLPAASGGTGTLAYTLKLSDGNALPTGFVFTASSRTLASTTAVVAATRTLRYTVTDDNNVSVYQDFNVVVAATPTVSDPADLRWSAGNLNTPVMLPAGSGGTGTLAYTLKLSNGNALPTGFVFTTSSRTLSNTTDVVAATRTLRYTVTDDNNASVYQDFNVVVVAAQSFSSSQTDLAWTAGHANTSVLLPAASGGTGTLAYTLKLSDGNALPTGFEFTASSRTLASTTAVVAATRTLRYTVTDDNNVSVYQDFNVVVAATPTVSDPADLRWSAGNLNTPVMLPAGSGGTGTLAYTLKLSNGNALPTGFVFTTSSRTLSNTTDVVAATRTLRYTVTDDNNASVYQDFNVVVVAAQSFSSSQTDLAWTAGHANTSVLLPAASGGTGTLAYTLKLSDGNALPTGFEFTASSRTLASTTAVVAATRTLRYTVTDDNNVSVYQDFNVVVAATPTVSDPADLRWSAGNLNTPVMLPAGSGGTGTLAYTLKLSNGNALPTGFVFTTSSRTLSNTTDVVAATRTLRYTVTDDNNASVYQDFNVVVVAAQSFSSSQTDLAWTAGHANTSVLLPAASGGTGTLAYTLKLSDGNALPTGFEFTASSRTLASTTAVVAATRTLRYTVTDDNNVSVYQDFNVVVAATPTVSDPADLRWSAGNLNTPVMLPAGSGGTGTLAYTLKLSNGNALPTGFEFTTSSRTLSNTTDVVAATRTLRYTVTDDNNVSVYQDFNVVVVAAQSFSSSQTDLAWTAGHANTSVLLPAASGGTGTLAYTLKLSDGNALPTGFVFTASSRTLASTTAVVAATRTLRYTVTDDNNVSVYQDFNVVVAATPTVSDPADLRWSAGNLNTPVMLPAGSGGTGTLAYTLKLSNGNALPTGFVFTASSRTLSNTTDVVAATRTLRYTVTDDNNASVYQDFNVVVVAAQSFSSSQTDLAWTAGHANTSVLLPAASGGTGTLAYTLKLSDGNALPTGFEFTASSRTLASTTAVVAATRTLRYTVTDDNNVSVYQDFNVVVAATPTVSDPADLRWSAGNLNTPVMLPAGSGGTGTLAYTLKLSNGNALPTGFVFTTSSRTLSNTTDVVAATRTLRYTVTDDNNASVYQDFNVVVVAAQSFSSSQTDLAWTAGHANTSVLLPAASGGTGTLAYTLKLSDGNALPTGFEFTASSRTLSSTTAVVAATRTLRYTVTDDNNVSVYQDFNVVVAAAPSGGGSSRRVVQLPVPDDLVWTADDTNMSAVLPAGSGGIGPLSYSVTLPDGLALPSGFEFDASKRMLSASPPTLRTLLSASTPTLRTLSIMATLRAESHTLRYTVTDARRQSASRDFVVTLVSSVPDVDRDAPYRPAVVWMVANGITKGCAQDRFCPDDITTPEQSVTFLWRAMGMPTPSYAGSEIFSDVEEGSYSDLAIGWASTTGLTLGCTSGQPDDPDWRFCLGSKLTRAHAAAFLYRFLKVKHQPQQSLPFEDVPPDSYYANAATWLHTNNIMAPCDTDRFCPYQAVSRAEMATFMHRIAATPSSWATARAPLPQLALINSE